jgi:hypothetical protein
MASCLVAVARGGAGLMERIGFEETQPSYG